MLFADAAKQRRVFAQRRAAIFAVLEMFGEFRGFRGIQFTRREENTARFKFFARFELVVFAALLHQNIPSPQSRIAAPQ